MDSAAALRRAARALDTRRPRASPRARRARAVGGLPLAATEALEGAHLPGRSPPLRVLLLVAGACPLARVGPHDLRRRPLSAHRGRDSPRPLRARARRGCAPARVVRGGVAPGI